MLLTALSSLAVTTGAQAGADVSAQLVDIPPVCSGGTDSYNFHQPSDPGNRGLDLIPKPTNFSGKSETYSTCTAAANGATKFFLKSITGSGNLACTVNANTTGRAEIHWLLTEQGPVVAQSKGEVLGLAIDGASKLVTVKIQVEDGAYAGHLLIIVYLSMADSRECTSSNGLVTVFGPVVTLTVV